MSDYDDSETAVYIFYINEKMYAWTTSKKKRDAFIKQRSKKAFKLKKKELDDITLRAFRSKYKSQELIEIPLDSPDGDLEIIGTYSEDTNFSDYCEKITNDLDLSIYYFDNQCPVTDELPDDYLKAILALSDVITKIIRKGYTSEYVRLDGVSIFFKLHKNTF